MLDPRAEHSRRLDERLGAVRAQAIAVPGNPDLPRGEPVAEVDHGNLTVGLVDG